MLAETCRVLFLLLLCLSLSSARSRRGNAPLQLRTWALQARGHIWPPGCFSTMRLSAKTPVSLQPPDLRLLQTEMPIGVVITKDVIWLLRLLLSDLSQPNSYCCFGFPPFSWAVSLEAHTSELRWIAPSSFRFEGSPSRHPLCNIQIKCIWIADNLQLS